VLTACFFNKCVSKVSITHGALLPGTPWIKPLFASNRCLRSKPLTKSRVALPIAPAMLLASTFIVRPSEPTLRSSYFKVTLYVFKVSPLTVVH
jgi:hypothetical protein